LATDLRIEDWDENSRKNFSNNIEKYKETSEKHHSVSKDSNTDVSLTNSYQLIFTDEEGNVETKRFERVEYSNRGKLLFNQVTSSIGSMGRAISDQEKRQILMEILKKLC
jgi:hypothetical protein